MSAIYVNKSYKAGIGFVALLLLLSAVGCTKKFDDINTPANLIVAKNVDATLLGQEFAAAEYYGLLAGQYQVGENLYADVYAQYFATTQPTFNSDQYAEQGAWTNIMWNEFIPTPPYNFFL